MSISFDDLIPTSSQKSASTSAAVSFDDLIPNQNTGATNATATTFGYRDPEDNGVGAWGDKTNNPDVVGVSLPRHVLQSQFGDENAAHGKMVQVTNPDTGKTITAPIIDKGPAGWVEQRQGATIDLTHAANEAIGGTGKTPVQYKFVDAPQQQSGSVSFDDLIPKQPSAAPAQPGISFAPGVLQSGQTTVQAASAAPQAQPQPAAQASPPSIPPPAANDNSLSTSKPWYDSLRDEFEAAAAKGTINTIGGVLRAASQIPVRAISEPAKEGANLMTAADKEADEIYHANPNDTSVAAGVGRGVGNALSMAPAMFTGPASLPLLALQGGGQAYAQTYDDTVNRLKDSGFDASTIDTAAHHAASMAAVKTVPELGAYLVGGKLTSMAVGGLLKEAAPLVKGLAGGTAAAGVNMATSAGIRAANGQPVSPNAESNTQDILFGAFHGVTEGQAAAAKQAVTLEPAKDPLVAAAEDKINAQAEQHFTSSIISPEIDKGLSDLGYSTEAIKRQTPAAARAIIASGERSPEAQAQTAETIAPQGDERFAPPANEEESTTNQGNEEPPPSQQQGNASDQGGETQAEGEVPSAGTESRVSGGVENPEDSINSFKFSDVKTPETIEEWDALRERRINAEKNLIKQQIGLNDEQAETLHRIALVDDANSHRLDAWAKKNLSDDQFKKYEEFFESEYNSKKGPVEFWKYDSYFNPSELKYENDKSGLAKDIVSAFTDGKPEEGLNDKWVWTVSAIRKFEELGGTKKEISDALKDQTGRVSGSDSSAEHWYKTRATDINEQLQRFAPDMPLDKTHLPEESQKVAQQIRDHISKNASSESGYIDLQPIMDKIHEYGKTIYKAGMDFASWSKQMITDLGDKVKDVLGQIWDAYKSSRYSSESGSVGSAADDFAKKFSNDHGIAARVTESRAKEGHLNDIPAGKGISSGDSIERGEYLLKKGADPEKIMKDFESTERFSSDDMSTVRAQDKVLQGRVDEALKKHGLDSKQYTDPRDAHQAWRKRVKAMQTEWSKAGEAQQAVSDTDTLKSFQGMQAEYTEKTEQPFTLPQADKAKKLSDEVNRTDEDATNATDVHAGKMDDALKNVRVPKPKNIPDAQKQVADEMAGSKARSLKQAEVLQAQIDAINKKIADLEAGKDIRKGKMNGPDEKAIADLKKQKDAANQKLKTAKINAAKAREFTPGDIPKTFTPEQVKTIWEFAKENYYDKGDKDYDAVVHGLSVDFGLPVDKIREALASPKGMRKVTDEMYNKQINRQRALADARNWLQKQKDAWWKKALDLSHDSMFALKTFAHGTTWGGTHAPTVLFSRDAPALLKNWARSFQYVFNYKNGKVIHYQDMNDLVQRPNWRVAREWGKLINDPFKFGDEYRKADRGNAFTKALDKVSGGRGFDALMTLRQDMFDRQWNKLPETMKTKDTAKVLADQINHSTGHSEGTFVNAGIAKYAMFAAKLTGSRFAWLIGDPAKAAGTFIGWRNASPAEKMSAISELNRKAIFLGAYASSLALNQALLQLAGSDEKINWTDYKKNDWLSFKGGGYQVAPMHAFTAIPQLAGRLYAAAYGPEPWKGRGTAEWEAVGNYAKNTVSPLAGFGLQTFGTHRDYEGNVLPFSSDVPAKGKRQLGWGEYASSFAPIPASESVTEYLRSSGMGATQAKSVGNAIIDFGVSGLMGTRAHTPEDEEFYSEMYAPHARAKSQRKEKPFYL